MMGARKTSMNSNADKSSNFWKVFLSSNRWVAGNWVLWKNGDRLEMAWNWSYCSAKNWNHKCNIYIHNYIYTIKYLTTLYIWRSNHWINTVNNLKQNVSRKWTARVGGFTTQVTQIICSCFHYQLLQVVGTLRPILTSKYRSEFQHFEMYFSCRDLVWKNPSSPFAHLLITEHHPVNNKGSPDKSRDDCWTEFPFGLQVHILAN